MRQSGIQVESKRGSLPKVKAREAEREAETLRGDGTKLGDAFTFLLSLSHLVTVLCFIFKCFLKSQLI